MDIVTPEIRSRIMAAVRRKDTRPEMLVRRLLHRLGYRFRLHRKDLPGTPDLVFPGRRKAIFVHGCFWHRHGCHKTTTPSSNREFWDRKFAANLARDRRAVDGLRRDGWEVLVVWECQVADLERLARLLIDFLGPRRQAHVN